MAFADDILRFKLKTERQMDLAFRKVVLDLDRKIIYRTPVDTGRARGNWQANIGPQPQANATDDVDSGGAATVGEVATVLENLKIGDTVWLSNALPYIRVLEYGLFPNPPKHGTGKTESGFSTQAIGGMVSVSAAEFGSVIEEAE